MVAGRLHPVGRRQTSRGHQGLPLPVREGTGAEWCVEDEEDEQLYQTFMEESDLEEEIDEEVVETTARRMRCLLQQEHEIVEENGGFARWEAQLRRSWNGARSA